MDIRKGLLPGALLRFPAMICVIESEIGRGSNAIVYRGWYEDALNTGIKHHVLIKELFPYHPKGAIYRDEASMRIICDRLGEDIMQLHRQSFIWGNEAHLRLREKAPADFGGNINTFSCNDTYYTLLDFSGGRSLLFEVQARGAGALRCVAQRMVGLLDALEVFHSMGFLHLDISPDNVLLINSGERERVELIDFNSVVPINVARASKGLVLSVKQGYASPEARAQAMCSIGEWTDLYSVTAVFFYCIMGRRLSSMEYGGIKKVDVGESALLADAPDTVKSIVAQIMARGLAVVAQKRYRSVEQMRMDMRELIDRIDGVGVTHWALWEMGRAAIRREIHLNPSLKHLLNEQELYPTHLAQPEGSDMDAFLRGQCNVALIGGGGAGKTTLLMRTALLQSRAYRKDRAAVIYVSLYGYGGEAAFIHDSLLKRMRFKPDTDGYAGARHALDLLLQSPLADRTGKRPVLCLLLDGYNEISGDAHPLKQEIEQLSKLPGVAIMLSSRTELSEYGFEAWRVNPLTSENVSDVLKNSGLLMPEEPKMCELLNNPMMLSLYVRACRDGGEQFVINTKAELIAAYLNALQLKEIQMLPEDSARRWQIEAAISCVYPVLADIEANRKRGIDSAALLGVIGALYVNLGKRRFLKHFPNLIGHSADIRAGAGDADTWYGMVIHDLLWRRLGLLYSDADGAYRVAHQEFRDELSESGRKIRAILARQKRGRFAGAGAACALALACVLMFWPRQAPAYGAREAIESLGYVQSVYTGLNTQFDVIMSLLQNQTPQETHMDMATYTTLRNFDDARDALYKNNSLLLMDLNGDGAFSDEFSDRIERALEEGYHFPWNEKAFDRNNFTEMTQLFDERQGVYKTYIDVLEAAYQSGNNEDYERCRDAIMVVIEADARVAAAYNCLLYTICTDGMAQWEGTKAGRDYEGSFNRLEDGRRYCSALEAFASADWRKLDAGEMISALTDAEKAQYDARMSLSKQASYVRYLQMLDDI